MNDVTSAILILTIGFALSGCSTGRPDHHVLKLDQTYNYVISNPHEWALQQFSNGLISEPSVSDCARFVLKYGLKESLVDLDADGTQELLLRQGCPARVWQVLVFAPAKGGYRYLGHFPASTIVLDQKQTLILVYEACGGKYGYIKTYRHDGHKFVGTMLQDIRSGDGYEENNKKMAMMFPKDRVIKWASTPSNAVEATRQ